MTFPTLGEFDGIPPAYQHAVWVADGAYAGGGYWAGYSLGEKLSVPQIERLWIDAGGPANVAGPMATIAIHESGGYTGAWNSTGATSLWQSEWPSNYKGPREDLFTPIIAAQNAVKLYSASGFGPWGSDPHNDPGVSPAPPGSVPGEHSHVPGGSPGGGNPITTTGITQSAGGSILGTILGANNWQDMLERLGLIVLGGVLVIVGVWMLAGKSAIKIGIKAAAPEASIARDVASAAKSKGEGNAGSA